MSSSRGSLRGRDEGNTGSILPRRSTRSLSRETSTEQLLGTRRSTRHGPVITTVPEEDRRSSLAPPSPLGRLQSPSSPQKRRRIRVSLARGSPAGADIRWRTETLAKMANDCLHEVLAVVSQTGDLDSARKVESLWKSLHAATQAYFLDKSAEPFLPIEEIRESFHPDLLEYLDTDQLNDTFDRYTLMTFIWVIYAPDEAGELWTGKGKEREGDVRATIDHRNNVLYKAWLRFWNLVPTDMMGGQTAMEQWLDLATQIYVTYRCETIDPASEPQERLPPPPQSFSKMFSHPDMQGKYKTRWTRLLRQREAALKEMDESDRVEQWSYHQFRSNMLEFVNEYLYPGDESSEISQRRRARIPLFSSKGSDADTEQSRQSDWEDLVEEEDKPDEAKFDFDMFQLIALDMADEQASRTPQAKLRPDPASNVDGEDGSPSRQHRGSGDSDWTIRDARTPVPLGSHVTSSSFDWKARQRGVKHVEFESQETPRASRQPRARTPEDSEDDEGEVLGASQLPPSAVLETHEANQDQGTEGTIGLDTMPPDDQLNPEEEGEEDEDEEEDEILGDVAPPSDSQLDPRTLTTEAVQEDDNPGDEGEILGDMGPPSASQLDPETLQSAEYDEEEDAEEEEQAASDYEDDVLGDVVAPTETQLDPETLHDVPPHEDGDDDNLLQQIIDADDSQPAHNETEEDEDGAILGDFGAPTESQLDPQTHFTEEYEEELDDDEDYLHLAELPGDDQLDPEPLEEEEDFEEELVALMPSESQFVPLQEDSPEGEDFKDDQVYGVSPSEELSVKSEMEVIERDDVGHPFSQLAEDEDGEEEDEDDEDEAEDEEDDEVEDEDEDEDEDEGEENDDEEENGESQRDEEEVDGPVGEVDDGGTQRIDDRSRSEIAEEAANMEATRLDNPAQGNEGGQRSFQILVAMNETASSKPARAASTGAIVRTPKRPHNQPSSQTSARPGNQSAFFSAKHRREEEAARFATPESDQEDDAENHRPESTQRLNGPRALPTPQKKTKKRRSGDRQQSPLVLLPYDVNVDQPVADVEGDEQEELLELGADALAFNDAVFQPPDLLELDPMDALIQRPRVRDRSREDAIDVYLVDEDRLPLVEDPTMVIPPSDRKPKKSILHGTVPGKKSAYVRKSGYRRWTRNEALFLYRQVQKVPMSEPNPPCTVVDYCYGEWGTRSRSLRFFNAQHMKDKMRDLVKGRLHSGLPVVGRARHYLPPGHPDKIRYTKELNDAMIQRQVEMEYELNREEEERVERERMEEEAAEAESDSADDVYYDYEADGLSQVEPVPVRGPTSVQDSHYSDVSDVSDEEGGDAVMYKVTLDDFPPKFSLLGDVLHSAIVSDNEPRITSGRATRGRPTRGRGAVRSRAASGHRKRKLPSPSEMFEPESEKTNEPQSTATAQPRASSSSGSDFEPSTASRRTSQRRLQRSSRLNDHAASEHAAPVTRQTRAAERRLKLGKTVDEEESEAEVSPERTASSRRTTRQQRPRVEISHVSPPKRTRNITEGEVETGTSPEPSSRLRRTRLSQRLSSVEIPLMSPNRPRRQPARASALASPPLPEKVDEDEEAEEDDDYEISESDGPPAKRTRRGKASTNTPPARNLRQRKILGSRKDGQTESKGRVASQKVAAAAESASEEGGGGREHGLDDEPESDQEKETEDEQEDEQVDDQEDEDDGEDEDEQAEASLAVRRHILQQKVLGLQL